VTFGVPPLGGEVRSSAFRRPSNNSPMYHHRAMTADQRARVLDYRRRRCLPLHSPPHWAMGFSSQYLISAACYEHAAVIGTSPDRLTQCEEQLLNACAEHASKIYAWCILPNHYHVLLATVRIRSLCRTLGQFHGRSSYQWNLEDKERGRKVWYRCFDREIRSERHFWATVNYIHHNPIHHGLVEKWQDWIWSSAGSFVEKVGKDKATEIWKEYPILDYGKGWDD